MKKDVLKENKEEISVRIKKFLELKSFEISEEYYKYIHRYLFNGILEDCGEYRQYNVSKKEEILLGDSVVYSDYSNIPLYMEYDIRELNEINVSNYGQEKMIKHVSDFTSRLWLTHPFSDGNTRTVSIFMRKYLQANGYGVNEEIFKHYFTYYREALVRSAYSNYKLGMTSSLEPLNEIYYHVINDKELSTDFVKTKKLIKNKNYY